MHEQLGIQIERKKKRDVWKLDVVVKGNESRMKVNVTEERERKEYALVDIMQIDT